MDVEAERTARKKALDSAHKRARDEYFRAFDDCYHKVLVDERSEESALAAADGAARRAYVEMHCAVYKEVCGNERANFDVKKRQSENAALSA